MTTWVGYLIISLLVFAPLVFVFVVVRSDGGWVRMRREDGQQVARRDVEEPPTDGSDRQ